ncbi:hypothetical protein XH93_40800 [Bradyrhizobium sp. CCBAU 51753]|nr:hypothetical protein XH93_40800 [Bradyrhizobium sp. CCBAU 51753]
MKLCPHPPLSSPGMTGRSSTPRPLGSFTTASGILDHPPARVMTPSKLSKPTPSPFEARPAAQLPCKARTSSDKGEAFAQG